MERGGVFDRPRVALAAGMFLTLSFMLVWQALGINPQYRNDPVIVTALLTAIVGLVGVEALSLRRAAATAGDGLRDRLIMPGDPDNKKSDPTAREG